MNRTIPLLMAGGLALLALAPGAQADTLPLPIVHIEVQGDPVAYLLSQVPPPPPLPTLPACINPANSPGQIAFECEAYFAGPFKSWVIDQVIPWAQEYAGRASNTVPWQQYGLALSDAVTQNGVGYTVWANDQIVTPTQAAAMQEQGALVAYGLDAAGRSSAWAAGSANALGAYGSNAIALTSAYVNSYVAAVLAYGSNYATAFSAYESAYLGAFNAYGAATEAQAVADTTAIYSWAVCHALGAGCQVLPPTPHVPGVPPVPGLPPVPSSNVPQPGPTPAYGLPNLPEKPVFGIPPLPQVPNPSPSPSLIVPLPPAIPQPNPLPPPPSQ